MPLTRRGCDFRVRMSAFQLREDALCVKYVHIGHADQVEISVAKELGRGAGGCPLLTPKETYSSHSPRAPKELRKMERIEPRGM